MAGKTLDELGIHEPADPKHVSVKEVVFPFTKFPGVDIILGPEMRSHRRSHGHRRDVPHAAFAKSQLAAGTSLPTKGKAFHLASRRAIMTASCRLQKAVGRVRV